MGAGEFNFKIEQGATFNIDLFVDDAGVVRNITGYTAKLDIREKPEDTTPILTLSTANGRITIAGALGKISLNLTATETAALTFTRAVYDLELTNGANIERLIQGTITLSKEVTRS